jgi:hypothetical protein
MTGTALPKVTVGLDAVIVNDTGFTEITRETVAAAE